MNKKLIYSIGIGIFALLLVFYMPRYFSSESSITGNVISNDITKIEVIHFHGTHQCNSCIMVGKLAEETINTYFADELKSGKISFTHLNAELPENLDKVKKYGVRSASLWIGTYYQDEIFISEENVNVWYKINNKEEYMNYLRGIIEQKFSGN